MADDFRYDVFLSHSSKDKAVVRAIAERLWADGLRVWFDSWQLRPGDSIPAKIEEGLEHSRVLVLCMSAHAFGSDWATLESQTFRFRDPLNKDLRFIPVRLDETPIKGSLAQFLYIDWSMEDSEQAYAKLLEACLPPVKPTSTETHTTATIDRIVKKVIQLNFKGTIYLYAFNSDGERALSGADDNTVRLWDVETGQCLRVLEGHTDNVYCVAWSADQRHALSGAYDNTVRLWDMETGQCLRVLNGHKTHVYCVAWSTDQRHALSGAGDHTIRLWDVETGQCLRVLEGHTKEVFDLAWSTDQRRALSAGGDQTVRLWDVETGQCLRVLKGHTSLVVSLAWCEDQRLALSGSLDQTVRLWDVETGRCLCVLEGHTGIVYCVAWSADQRYAFSADQSGYVRVWDLSEFVIEARALEAPAILPPTSDQVQYTNAKILLVGESGAGKTGLSKVLAGEKWQPSDSTVGAWATQWKLPVSSAAGVEREIWLWDFGGQADQRLIHQLYMDETALAVLVFDGQKEDLFETLGQWDRDLTRASRKEFAKLLVAGRVDAGGLRVSRSQVEAFAKERGYTQFLETSAKADLGCEELKQAILDASVGRTFRGALRRCSSSGSRRRSSA